MIQLNNLEGDYNTGIDYGTVDESETQSPFGTSGPNEVIPTLFLLFFLQKPLAGVVENVSWKKCIQGSFWYDMIKTHRTLEESVCFFDRLKSWHVGQLMDMGNLKKLEYLLVNLTIAFNKVAVLVII